MSTALAAVHSSNMAPRHKNLITNWLSEMRSGGANAIERAGQHGVAAVKTVRQYGEAGITGAALAAAHVYLPEGLDIKGKMPIDLGAAIVGAGLAIAMPGDEISISARNIGANAGAVFSFRKTFAFLAAKHKHAGKKVGGTFAGETTYASMGAEATLMEKAAML